MLTKIKRQDCLAQYRSFPLRSYDEDEEKFFYPKVYKNYILVLASKSFTGHVKALGIEMTKLTKAFNANTLIFLGDTEAPWLYQHNDYKPVREAEEYLTANKIGKRFCGALQVNTAELPTFVKHLAWLTRCNATLSNFNFTDEGQTIVGSICKYGNLHLETLNEQADKALKSFVGNSKFQYGDSNSCYNEFGKTSAISGRQTVV
ncbi:hypothetical protein [Tellurirhabdus rosea]|uniref:hypothetical protein n=1 Tax=Tellurirhabdus rosea TaxID=2674997 RepID=UPI00224D1B0E|nr:hypothetical protein [Tellurirhabdus rosea]